MSIRPRYHHNSLLSTSACDAPSTSVGKYTIHDCTIGKGDLSAEPVLLAPDGPKSQCSCGDLKPNQEQAIDVQVLCRGMFPPAPAQPPAIVYQAAAGKSVYLPARTGVVEEGWGGGGGGLSLGKVLWGGLREEALR